MAEPFMSRGAIIAGLLRQNVPRAKAEAEADRILAEEAARARTPRHTQPGRQFGKPFTIEREAAAREAEGYTVYRGVPASASVEVPFQAGPFLPLHIRVPWSVLVSDNVKDRCACRGAGTAVRLTTPAYKDARAKIAAIGAEAMNGRPPADLPLRLLAWVWVPNNHRRDVVNFSKALHDAFNGVVWTDDSWLYDVRWIRAGVDVDAPRLELIVSPYIPGNYDAR